MVELMTLQEVAAYLRVTEKTIYRLLGRRGIPATKVGRQWRFDRALINEWLHRSSVGAKASILIIDNQDVIRALFKDVLEEQGYRVAVAETGAEGLELVKQQDFDMVFLDLKMSGVMDGAKLFGQIKAIKPKLPVTITTGSPDSDMMARALAQGPFAIMNKPYGEQDVIAAVDRFLRSTRAREPR